MTSLIKTKLHELANFMGVRQDCNTPDDDHKSLQGIDDRLYKLGIFMHPKPISSGLSESNDGGNLITATANYIPSRGWMIVIMPINETPWIAH